MGNSINKFSELKAEKEKLAIVADDRLKQMKNSIHTVSEEGRSVMVNKILIPVGIAVVAGYGLKKLIDFMQSPHHQGQENSPPHKNESQPSRLTHSSAGHGGGLLSGINWSSLAVQLVPFIINVGKKMYEDGNLPYISPHPSKVEEEEPGER